MFHRLSPSGINLPPSGYELPLSVDTEAFTDVAVGPVNAVMATVTRASQEGAIYMVTGYIIFNHTGEFDGSYLAFLSLNGAMLPSAGRVDITANTGLGSVTLAPVLLPNSDFAVGAGVFRLEARADGGPLDPTASGELSLYQLLPSSG